MTLYYVDILGLSATPSERYADLLQLDGPRLRTPAERLNLLRQLREGSGVVVYTGPLGAPYWSLASHEVKVRVAPDDYDYEPRVTNAREWSYLAAGCEPLVASALAIRNKPLTPRHGLYAREQAASAFLEALESVPAPSPLVVEQFPVEIIHDRAEQLRFMDSLTGFVAVDGEWDPDHGNDLIAFSVSDADRNFYLPVQYAGYAAGWAGELRQAFGRLLDRGTPCVFHNAKADIETQYMGDLLRLSGKPIDDTLVMAYLVGEPELALKTLSRKLLDRDPTDYPGNLNALPLALGARYACADTRNTYDLYGLLRRRLEETGQLSVYESIERPLVPIIASMERNGSPLDVGELYRMQSEIATTEEGIRGLAWARWRRDLGSDKDTRLLMADMLGYDPGTLDQRVLSLIQDPWMDVVLGFRKLRTLRRNFLDSYIDQWKQSGYPSDFRLFASFNQAGNSDTLTGRSFKRAPRTGRLSSARPNLMQVPRELRSVFSAPPDEVFWSFDFSQLEIRLAAGISRDPAMLGELRKPDGDIHGLMRAKIHEAVGMDVGRPVAKQANFNLRYGSLEHPDSDVLVSILAKERAFIAKSMADQIVQVDRNLYAGYWDWVRSTLATAKQRGYSETIKGRRTYYADLDSPDPYFRGHAERAAVNLVIQGSASDVVKEAMVRVVPILRHFGAKIRIQVHDELCGSVSRAVAEPFKQAVLAVMQSIEVPGLHLAVSGGYGTNWGEAK